MKKEEIMAAITEIFQNVFDDDTLILGPETTAEEIEDWDSLEQINLLVAMEHRFHIKFKLDDVSALQNVGDMIALVESMTA